MNAFVLAAVLTAATPPAADMTVEQAISSALVHDEGLAAGRAEVAGNRARLRASQSAELPTASLTGQVTATNDPLAAFGMRLQERAVAAPDFAPDRLNTPGLVGAGGLGLEVALPLYAGGAFGARREGASALAAASEAAQERQRQQLAVQVVATYFQVQLAERAVTDAESALTDARQIEQLTTQRASQQLALEADVSRAQAFRARAQAEETEAQQRAADARDALVLLVGEEARSARLATAVEDQAPPPVETAPSTRADIEAAAQRERQARAQIELVRSTQRPQLALQVRGQALWGGGSALGASATAGLAARWDFLALSRGAELEAAAHAAEAAAAQHRGLQQRALAEVAAARRAVTSVEVRLAATREALAASEKSLALRRARHREGLLPLDDLLAADTALRAARAAVRETLFAQRLSRVRLAFTLGAPIQGS